RVAPPVPSERPAPGPPKVLSRNFQKISPRVQKNQRHPHCPRNTHPRNSSRREKSQQFHWHTTPAGKKPAPPGLFDMNRPRVLTIISVGLIKRHLASPPSSPSGSGGHRSRVSWESGRETVREAPGEGVGRSRSNG